MFVALMKLGPYITYTRVPALIRWTYTLTGRTHMKVNEVKYDEDNTYALMNAIGPKAILDNSDPLYEYYERAGVRDDKALFKQVFGPQQITVKYRHRNWVWTFANSKATIHCLLSVRGIAWEYNRATSDVNALEPLMKEIVRKLTSKRTKK